MKSPKVRFVITLLFGWSGLHRFMAKKPWTGLLYLCTFGLCGIGWLYDIIKAWQACVRAKRAAEAKAARPEKESFEVVGLPYRMDAVESLARLNAKYNLTAEELIENGYAGDRIYKYSYKRGDVKLIPEPDNAHDSNAIKVVFSGTHIGYISSAENAALLARINAGDVDRVTGHIGGGDYRIVSEDGSDARYQSAVSATVTVTYKPQPARW